MLHIVVKLWLGRNDDIKSIQAKRIASPVAEELNVNMALVSVAIEEVPRKEWIDNQYHMQIVGSTDELRKFTDETFIIKGFARILKHDGQILSVKLNGADRVMQMVVRLNNFGHTHSLPVGNDRVASQ